MILTKIQIQNTHEHSKEVTMIIEKYKFNDNVIKCAVCASYPWNVVKHTITWSVARSKDDVFSPRSLSMSELCGRHCTNKCYMIHPSNIK